MVLCAVIIQHQARFGQHPADFLVSLEKHSVTAPDLLPCRIEINQQGAGPRPDAVSVPCAVHAPGLSVDYNTVDSQVAMVLYHVLDQTLDRVRHVRQPDRFKISHGVGQRGNWPIPVPVMITVHGNVAPARLLIYHLPGSEVQLGVKTTGSITQVVSTILAPNDQIHQDGA